jgi:protoheme ferro-lyase
MTRNTINFCHVLACLAVVSFCIGCSVRQDNTNFEKYLKQDTTIKGKVGVLITALGQPEDYDFMFFNNYLNLIFTSSFPPLLKFFIMGDKGTVLRDPDNLFAKEEFKPKTLMDCFGNTKNADGVPYTDLRLEWVKPRKKGDGGYFLWDKGNGYVDIAEKSAIKIVASYYDRMPGKKIPYIQQHVALFKDVKSLIAGQFPATPVRTAWTMYPETIKKAIDELLREKVETIVVCDLFPVYSNLEEFNSLFVEIDHLVAGRVKVVFAPSVGAFSSFRNAYVKMAEDEIAKRSKAEKSLIVLTRHGFPEMPGEPYHKLAPAFYQNLEKEVTVAVGGKNTSIVFADTEFASDDDDPDNTRLSSAEALKIGLEKQYDNIIFILVDFMTENTDTVYCAREEALEPINFEYAGIVPYNDFSQPFRTELTKDKTRIVIAGTPVGSRYRIHVAKGIFDAVATILQGREWPQLVQKNKKAEKPKK